jgi:hypothetical protein
MNLSNMVVVVVVVFLFFSQLVSSVVIGLVLRIGFFGIVKLTLWVVLIDCVLVGIFVSTLYWFAFLIQIARLSHSLSVCLSVCLSVSLSLTVIWQPWVDHRINVNTDSSSRDILRNLSMIDIDMIQLPLDYQNWMLTCFACHTFYFASINAHR